jgi:hypothetical protein
LDFIQHFEETDAHQISRACFEWLRARRLLHGVSFLPNDMGIIEALLQDAYRSFLSGRNLAVTFAGETDELAAVKTELATAQAEAAAAKAEAAAARNSEAAAKAGLAALRASTSWRLTRPLRQLANLVRYGELGG